MIEQDQNRSNRTGTLRASGPQSVREVIIALALIGAVWELVARFVVNAPIVLPGPGLVWQAGVENSDLYAQELAFTFYEVILGFLAGFTLGFVSAVGIYYSAMLTRFLYPVLVGLQIVPKVAFLPLFAIWFGIGTSSKVVLAAFATFFVVLVQTLLGLRGIDPQLVEFGRSLRMNEKLLFRKMRLPAALPSVMVGVRLCMILSLTLVVVAEMSVANRGVGWLIIDSRARFQTDEMMAAIAVVALAGVLLFGLGRWLENRLTAWNVDESG